MLVAAAVVQPALMRMTLADLLPPQAAQAQTSTSVTYAYDANGNLLSRDTGATTDTYIYDAENRLLSATSHRGASETSASFTYDADGLRTGKTADGATTTFLVDKNRVPSTCDAGEGCSANQGLSPSNPDQGVAQVLVETTGATAASYTHGLDLISQNRPGFGAHFYVYDGQFSTRHLTDPAGVVSDSYAYDAFGALLAAAGTTPNDYLYTGEQFDPNIGFYYLRARYYDQAIGRFVTTDPQPGSVFDPVSLHRYLYANADPVNNADPSGEETLGSIMTSIAIQSALAGLAVGIAAGIATKNVKIGIVVGLLTFAFVFVALWVRVPAAANAAAELLARQAFLNVYKNQILNSAVGLGGSAGAHRVATALLRYLDGFVFRVGVRVFDRRCEVLRALEVLVATGVINGATAAGGANNVVAEVAEFQRRVLRPIRTSLNCP